MGLFIVLLILALIIFGVGFAVHLLWWLLIIVLVIAVLNWLFGRRAGFLSAATILGSFYFARHTRLAETDVPAMLFVTLASYALWRGLPGNALLAFSAK